MASKKTWIWIIVGVVGACVLGVVALAGVGVYFVSQHVSAKRSTPADALQAVEAARAFFKDQPPLLELDSFGRPQPTRPFASLPTSATKPSELWVLAWNADDEKLVKLSVPFWILRFGRRKLDVNSGDSGFDLDRLHLDINELERIGPTLILDLRHPNGERVLVWTR
jgi:hypothetical protein